MAVTYGFFDSVNGDRTYNADQMSKFYNGIVTSGVFQHVEGGLAVSAGSGMTVSVATGRAIVNNRWVDNSAALTLSIGAASSTYARIDAVVIKLSMNSRFIDIYVKAGEAASSPVAPTMDRADGVYEMALAYVNVAAGATSVTVTDKRSDSAVCGWASVAQATSGEVDQMLNDMKTGFDGVVYSSPAAMVQGCDTFLQNQIATLTNAFDKTTITQNYLLVTSTGVGSATTGGFYSALINVADAKSVFININLGSTFFGHAFYDEDQTYISGVNSYGSGDGTGELIATVPDNAEYMRISGFISKVDDIVVYVLGREINEIEIIKENTTNDVVGTIISDCFVSVDGSNRVMYYTLASSKTASCDVSKLKGKKIHIESKQVNTSYKLIYVFADKDNYKISMYSGSSTAEESLNANVIVPNNAETLFVNCATTDNVVVTSGSNNCLHDYPRCDMRGKKIVTYGDSLTYYDTHTFTWGPDAGMPCVGFQTYLRNMLGLSTTNRGESGYTTPQFCSIIRNGTDFDTFDYVTIMGGDNDDRLGVAVGTIQPVGGNFDTNTIYGALQSAIEYILNENPAIRIILMTEPMGWTYQNGVMDRVSDLIPNAYRKVAELYGLPLIDLWLKSGINELTRSEYYLDPVDGNTDYMYHPNNKGWKNISKIICDEIEKY